MLDINGAPPFLQDFINHEYFQVGCSEKTCKEYYLDLRMFFRFMKRERGLVDDITDFDEIEIADICNMDFIKTIDKTDIYNFFSYIIDERHASAAATRNRKLATLKTFFAYCSYDLPESICLDSRPTERIRTTKLPKREPVYLTEEDARNLLSAVSGRYQVRDFCIIMIFLNCGIRISELTGLNLDDIRSDGTMLIHGKGNKERTLYLNAACIEAINAYLPYRDAAHADADGKKALFLSQKHRRIGNQAVRELVERSVLKAGLSTKYTPHKLRHTAATLMAAHGIDVNVVRDVLGHESLSTTQIYTHVTDTQIREAIDANPLGQVSKQLLDSQKCK